jgi:hypothetical protein
MQTWLRSVVEMILGRVPGKASRLDTATRMAMDADFGGGDEASLQAPPRPRNNISLIKPIGPAADAALFQELVRIVNEAQGRDVEDERSLYSPIPIARPLLSKRERLVPRARF